jgi:hypothetical protein
MDTLLMVTIDSVRAKGEAQCIYFIQDNDSAYSSINQSQSDLMDIYFRDKELSKVVFRSQVSGTIWPIRQKRALRNAASLLSLAG